MMKKNTKFIFAFTIITFLTIFSYSPNVYATNYIPSENYQYSNYDYVIDKYDINIIKRLMLILTFLNMEYLELYPEKILLQD